jgi:hypothetical protein
VADELKKLPFHWIVAPPKGWRHDELADNVAALKRLWPGFTNTLVVIDFAQLMTGNERELRERISSAAYAARAAAREHNAAVLMLSSTPRDNYKLTEGLVVEGKGDEKKNVWDGPPSALVGLGKESGDTEYASDSVLVLIREPWPGRTPPPEGTRFHLAVAKLRAGTPAWVDLWFNGSLFADRPFTVNANGEGRSFEL